MPSSREPILAILLIIGSMLSPDLTGSDATEEQFCKAVLDDKISALGLNVAERPAPPAE